LRAEWDRSVLKIGILTQGVAKIWPDFAAWAHCVAQSLKPVTVYILDLEWSLHDAHVSVVQWCAWRLLCRGPGSSLSGATGVYIYNIALALALAARRHASRQTLAYTLLLMLMWPWQPALLPCSYDSTTLAALPTTPTVTTLLNFAAAPPPQHPQASHHTGLLVYLGPNTAWPCGVHVRLGCVWCSCTGMKSASLDDHFGAPFHRLVSQTLTHGCIQ